MGTGGAGTEEGKKTVASEEQIRPLNQAPPPLPFDPVFSVDQEIDQVQFGGLGVGSGQLAVDLAPVVGLVDKEVGEDLPQRTALDLVGLSDAVVGDLLF